MICLFESSTCFEQPRAHPQEDNCINTTSGIIISLEDDKEIYYTATSPAQIVGHCRLQQTKYDTSETCVRAYSA